MRERYRNMMERETLCSETKTSILERMERADSRKTVRQHLRTVLIAGCLCLMLAGTVFTAMAVNGFSLWASVTPKEDGSYALEVSNRLKLYAIETFSPAIQEDMATAESTSQIIPVRVENWQEALDYVSVPLLENILLDNRALFQTENPQNEDSTWQLWVHLHPGLVYISRSYEMDGVLVNVQTGIFTEQYDGRQIVNDGVPFWWNYFELDGEGGITTNAEYDDMFRGIITVDETWTDTMTDGTNVLFVRTKNQNTGRYWYSAGYVYNGIAYNVLVYDAEEVRAWLQGHDPQKTTYNPELDYEGVLRLVIDGFAFE